MKPNPDGRFPNCPEGIKEAMARVRDGEDYHHLVDWDDDGSRQQSEKLVLLAVAGVAMQDPDAFSDEERHRIALKASEHGIGQQSVERSVQIIEIQGGHL